MKTYLVKRRYVCEERILVEAESKKKALEEYDNPKWHNETEVIRYFAPTVTEAIL